MKQIKFSTFFEWYFSDANSEGINITHYNILNDKLFDVVNKLFNECIWIPERLLDEGGFGELRAGVEVVLIRD